MQGLGMFRESSARLVLVCGATELSFSVTIPSTLKSPGSAPQMPSWSTRMRGMESGPSCFTSHQGI